MSVPAQDIGGAISGRVSSQGTGAYLQGAEVSVEGTNLTTLTQRDGSFTLTRVPAGAQTLRVTYTGLDPHSEAVSVTAGKTSSVDVAMTAEFYVQLETFTVAGQREGNAASITRQRNAENLVNIVSMDTYGNVADGNIGNFLAKLAGTAAFKEAGEIIGVSIRGTPPELNAVTVDGTRRASAVAGFTVQGDRGLQLDRIPSEFIKEIEITKGIRPDQWADSLGGTINLVTKSAFDFPQRVITYRAGATLNTYRDDQPWGPTAAFSYLDAFGPGRTLGIAISGSHTETTNTRDRIQMEHRTTDDRNTRARTLDDTNARVRAGLAAKVEYRPDPSLRLKFDVSGNRFKMDTKRFNFNATTGANIGVADYNVVSRAAIEAGTTPRTSANAVAGVAPGFTAAFTEMLHATWITQVAIEAKRSEDFKVGFAVEKDFARGKLSLSVSHNPSEFDNTFEGFTATLPGVGFSVDTTNPVRPIFRQTYGTTSVAPGTDFSRFTGRRFAEGPDRTEDQFDAANADLVLDFKEWQWPVSLKTGLAVRRQERSNQLYRPAWNLVGADGRAGLNPVTGINDDNIAQFRRTDLSYGLFNGEYPQRDTFDYARVVAFFNSNPSHFAPVGTSVSFRPPPNQVTESVYAGYVMGNIDLGQLTVTGGTRIEATDIDASGRLNDPLRPSEIATSASSDYRKLFPSLHFRYEPRRNLVLRASWSTSSARPSISDVVPTTIVTYSTDGSPSRVTRNDPGLKPQYSVNYDFSVEYYFEPAGVLSAGYFHKDVEDFLFTAASVIPGGTGNGFGGRYQDFILTSTINGGGAKISGFELGYNQQLRMLPRPFDGLSVFANYTRLETSGQYARGISELADFVPETINAGLAFEWRKFEARYAYNFRSSFLQGVAGTVVNPIFPGFSTDDETMDIHLQYKWRPGLTFFVDYINFLNKSPSWYTLNPSRIEMTEYYGGRLTVGISGRF